MASSAVDATLWFQRSNAPRSNGNHSREAWEQPLYE